MSQPELFAIETKTVCWCVGDRATKKIIAFVWATSHAGAIYQASIRLERTDYDVWERTDEQLGGAQ